MPRLWGKKVMISVYVSPEKKQSWEAWSIEKGFSRVSHRQASSDGKGPKLLSNLSPFIEWCVDQVIRKAKPRKGVSQDDADRLQAKIGSLNAEITALRKQNQELQGRVIGVAEDRVLQYLSADKTIRFDHLVAKLRENEHEAVFETLRRLAEKGSVEYVGLKDGWRLKKRGK